MFDLIERKRVTQVALDLGPEPIAAMNEWLAVHMQHGYGIGLEWKSQRETRRAVEILYPQVPELQSTIAETRAETQMEPTGELIAVDTRNKTFVFKPDDGDEIAGTYESAITAEHAATLPARYRVTLIRTTRIITAKKDRDKAVTHFMADLLPLWKKQ